MKNRVLLMALAAMFLLVSSNTALAQSPFEEFDDDDEGIAELGSDVSSANTTAKQVFNEIVIYAMLITKRTFAPSTAVLDQTIPLDRRDLRLKGQYLEAGAPPCRSRRQGWELIVQL